MIVLKLILSSSTHKWQYYFHDVQRIYLLQAGLSSLGGEMITIEELRQNAPRVSSLFEQYQPPSEQVQYSPTSPATYHVLTYGVLVDQLVRRVDPQHRPVATFLVDEFVRPLGLEEELFPAPTRDIFTRFSHFHSCKMFSVL